MDTGLGFFKWILTSEKMKIPRAFVAQMRGVLANGVVLKDRYENLWRVGLTRIGNDLYFDEGWEKFYEENSAERGNFLVFEYKGGTLFDFRLFGKDSLVKKGVGAFKFSVKQEKPNAVEENRAFVQDNDDNDNDDDDNDDEDDEYNDDSGDEVYVQEAEQDVEDEGLNISKNVKPNVIEEDRAVVHENNEDDDDADYDDDDDEDYVQQVEQDEEYEQFNISKNVKPENQNLSRGNTSITCKCRKQNVTKRKGNDENNEDDEEEEPVHISKKISPNSKSKSSPALERNLSRVGIGTTPSRRIYKKKNVPNCYGADIFESGHVPKPKNPYFVTRSRSSRQNELYIPREIIVDYHLEIPRKLYLVDEEGRKWETKTKQWKDGRLWCTKGWKSLCNVNDIGHDDACICEFVQGKASMDVHVLVHVVHIAPK